MIDAQGQRLTQLETDGTAKEFTDNLRKGITSTHFCTFAVRAEVLRKLEGCRQYFKTAEDIDLQLRIGEVCRVWFLPDLHYGYRIHHSSITHSQSNIEREFFEQTARDFQSPALAARKRCAPAWLPSDSAPACRKASLERVTSTCKSYCFVKLGANIRQAIN